jgi:hypothetical protein
MLALNPDLLDRRALALVEFLDPLGGRVTSAVTLLAEHVKVFAKRPGSLVVAEAPGFAGYAAAFETLPAVGATTLKVDILPADPRLAPRGATLALPRDPDPTRLALPGSLFQPLLIQLSATPLMPLGGLTAGLSVTVRRADDQRRVAGALVRLTPDGGRPQVLAVTDACGDALLLVPGVPLASPGAGAVVRRDIGGTLDAIIDPALAGFHADADLPAAREAARLRRRGFIDPDDLVARLAAKATPGQPVSLEAGRLLTASIAWPP